MLRRFSARLAIMMPGHAVGNLATRLYQGIVSGIIPLSGGTRAMIVNAFGQSVSVVYLWAIPVAAALLILALLLPTVPVRTRIEEEA
jgi:hypothetical protein